MRPPSLTGATPTIWLALVGIALLLPIAPSAGGSVAAVPVGPPVVLGSGPAAADAGNASVGATELAAAQASLTQDWGFSPTETVGCAGGTECPSALRGLPAVPASSTHATTGAVNAPPALIGASMAYDGVDQIVLLFGGLLQSGQPSNQTWEYATGQWLNETPFLGEPGVKQPAARWDAMMAFDSNDGYVLLYGGCSAPPVNGMCPTTFSDTWTYTEGGWSRQTGGKPPIQPPPPAPTPPPSPGFPTTGLWDASMVYDPCYGTTPGSTAGCNSPGAIVLFGGADGFVDHPPPPPGPNEPAEVVNVSSSTWVWSGAIGKTPVDHWENITTSTHPPAMYGAGFVAGTTSLGQGWAVLFGGTNITRYDVDIAPGVPQVVSDGGNVSGTVFDGTWAFALNGVWSRIPIPPAPPPGGTPQPFPYPAGRFDMGFVFDPNLDDGSAVLTGGVNATGAYMGDAWAWVGGATWEAVDLSGPSSGSGSAAGPSSPDGDWNFAMAYDALDQSVVLYGGASAAGSALGTLWVLPTPKTGAGVWYAGTSANVTYPSAPSSRYSSAAVFDDEARSVVLFGGESCGAASCTLLSDTWTFYDGAWTEQSLSRSPSPRYGAAIAYDPANGNVYLFGGCGNPCPLSDTWVYHQASPASSGGWSELFPIISPPGRYFATLTYDPDLGELVLFGGCEGANGPCPADDTWTLSSSGTWTDLELGPSASPPARFGAAATFVPLPIPNAHGVVAANQPTDGNLLLFGGMGSDGLLDDTWEFGTGPTSSSGSGTGAATPLEPRQSVSPPSWKELDSTGPRARVFGSLVYDGPEQTVDLFGGCEINSTGAGNCPAIDLAEFNLSSPPPPPPGVTPPPNTGDWSNRAEEVSGGYDQIPAAGYGMSAVWDPEGGPLGIILVVGGRNIQGDTVSDEAAFAGLGWNSLDGLT